MTLRSIAEEVFRLWSAGWPYILVETDEEERALAIGRLAAELGSPVLRFLPESGLTSLSPVPSGACAAGDLPPGGAEARDLSEAALALSHAAVPTMVVATDVFAQLADHRAVRRLRDLAEPLSRARHCVLMLDPPGEVPRALAEDLVRVILPPPDREELGALLEDLGGEADREALVAAAIGLSEKAARRAFAGAMGSDDPVGAVLAEKRRRVREGFAIEMIESTFGYDDVGGLESLKRWLGERERAFGQEARDFGLPIPKGVLLLGVQGCGKSISAKAVASHWRLPLMRLDLATVFGGGIPAERALRRAIALAEQLAPTVLWIDEIEKGFAGADTQGGQAVAEVSRVLGAFTTWLQEKEAPVFVVATANEVSTLPPELLRRGRFDEIFFVDLPDAPAREEILSVHLKRRRRDPAGFPLGALAAATEHFSGAELEQVVVAALYRAFRAEREMSTADLERSAADTVPLFRTYEERVKALRAWAKDRARPAGRSEGVIDLLRSR